MNNLFIEKRVILSQESKIENRINVKYYIKNKDQEYCIGYFEDLKELRDIINNTITFMDQW